MQEEGEVADVSEADRGAVEASENLSPPRCAQRTFVCTDRVISPNPFSKKTDIVRETTINLNNLEDSNIIDDSGTLMNIELSQQIAADP